MVAGTPPSGYYWGGHLCSIRVSGCKYCLRQEIQFLTNQHLSNIVNNSRLYNISLQVDQQILEPRREITIVTLRDKPT